MKKTKVYYCWRCGRDTKHIRIERDFPAKGAGIMRIFLAVASLGVSEVTIDEKYECSKCGEIY